MTTIEHAGTGKAVSATSGRDRTAHRLAGQTDSTMPLARPPELDITVVVPYYNPGGERLVPTVERLMTVLDRTGADYEVLAVNDGSTDGSAQDLEVAIARWDSTPTSKGRVRSITYTPNRGKGAALRTGIAQARGHYIGFIDADGDLDPGLMGHFLEVARATGVDMVVGSKAHEASVVDNPLIRRTYSWGYHKLVKALLKVAVKDTQTGAKLARRELMAAVVPDMLEDGFAFDVELLAMAHRLGYTKVLEEPIVLKRRPGDLSTVSMKAVWRTAVSTLAIFARLRLAHR